MANTKPTTRIRKSAAGVAVLGFGLFLFAAINLFASVTPVADRNDYVDDAMHKAVLLPVAKRLALFSDLRAEQERNLALKPSEPYGWSRLSSLRLATEGNPKRAFAALRMSDLVSPYEAPQLPERAWMWSRLRMAEDADQQAYQDILWKKAFSMDRAATWAVAVRGGGVSEVGVSLQLTDTELYEEWKDRVAGRY